MPSAHAFAAHCVSLRFRLKDRIAHPRADEYWPQCLAVERMSREELLALQARRLDDLVADICQHVPFYVEWARTSGFKPGDRVNLATLPVVTKQTFRDNIELFQSNRFPVSEMEQERTSGSSGEPFAFRKHHTESEYSYCCFWRAMRRYGIRPGERSVYLWGRHPRLSDSHLAYFKARLQNKARSWLSRMLVADAHSLNHEEASRLLRRIDRFNPVYIHGYTSAIYTLARQKLDEGMTFSIARPRLVVSDAEKLTPFQEETIREAFACPVSEHYGSVEFGNMAQRDPTGLLRLNEDLCVVETAPTGEAMITNLFARSFPFVRYVLGDLLVLGGNVPPLPFRTLESVTGRTVDMIPLPGGKSLHGFLLLYPISKHLRYLRKFQVKQVALDHFEIRYVPTEELPAAVRTQILTEFRSVVGATAQVDIIPVDVIPHTAGGKFRWVITDVATAPQANVAT